jgi:hypothetical protein
LKKAEKRNTGPYTNNDGVGGSHDLGDLIAVQIQRLHTAKVIYDDQPLLRIDNRKETENARYQFDIAQSVLHRSGCEAIPNHARTALYALWDITEEDLKYACSICKPVPQLRTIMDKTSTSDLLFGFLSIIDQFSSVLSERGSEYRQSEKGKQVEAVFTKVLDELDVQQQQSIDLLISSLDGLIKVLRDYNRNGGTSLKEHGNGAGGTAVVPARKNNGRAKEKPGIKARIKTSKK